jgi:hypothetical protein
MTPANCTVSVLTKLAFPVSEFLARGKWALFQSPVGNDGRSSSSRMGSKVGTVFLGPAERAWRYGFVLHMLGVDGEAVITVVRVIIVDETCEKPDVGVLLLRGQHCCEAVLGRREMAARSVREVLWIRTAAA